MKKFDNSGSIAPLLIFFLIIIMLGLLYGIFDNIIVAVEPVVSERTDMDNIMIGAWGFLLLIILIIIIGWLLMKAQKEKEGW
jgi:cell division protein FtsX